jgi:predicted HAD superfamily Cof-like phosphohydrolase
MSMFLGVKWEATTSLVYLAFGSFERLGEDPSWVTAAGINAAMTVLSRSRTTRASRL